LNSLFAKVGILPRKQKYQRPGSKMPGRFFVARKTPANGMEAEVIRAWVGWANRSGNSQQKNILSLPA